MKYILLIALISLISCERVSHGDIIRETRKSAATNKFTLYKVDSGAEFYGPKGLYQVGDTVKFSK